LAESLEILRRGLSGKRVVRPMVVESMGEGVDEGLQLIDSMRQIVGCIILISPGRLGAFDAAVEVGPLLRQREELQPARLTFGFEHGFERSAIDLNPLNPVSAKPGEGQPSGHRPCREGTKSSPRRAATQRPYFQQREGHVHANDHQTDPF
jgi:hypothetical protein